MRPACASFVALVLLGLGPTPTVAIAQEPSSAVSTPQGASRQVQQEAFSRQIAERMERVPEFKYIREEAARMGVKAYLFGGTAAGYAHYVKWDMQREAGDPRFQPDRFDYDYTNIYRSTQDLDIVVDGPPEKAAELQSKLASHFPHLQGSKTAWEVRLLRQDMGDKQALLNNPDFLNQHTDSNSTGMIEITKPVPGESVVRDLRDWNSKSPYFLQDVLNGKIHYYFSPSHETTAFAKQGRNPPIISVIRYLTKAFQYELEIRPEDLASIKKIIDAFQPDGPEMSNSYVRHWLLNKDNGRKLIQNAVNIEYAWDTLEKLGLRKKLAAIEKNPGTVGSLAWWMNKEPLRTHVVGVDPRTGHSSNGKTARELGLNIVAHETNNFLAYESITRAHTGDPNVLISRQNTAGEAAAYGDGFYTRIGREGARGTGLTIRFHLSPEAREGIDFAKTGDFVIVHNKAALRVIPESLNIDPVHLFEMLSEGKQFSNSDLGLLEKLKRRVSQSASRLSLEDRNKLTSIARKEFAKRSPNPLLMDMWFSYPFAKDQPELVENLIDKGTADEYVVQHILSRPEWNNRPDLITKLLKRGKVDVAIANLLIQPQWENHPELVEKLFESKTPNLNPAWLAQTLLQQPHWKKYPDLVEKLIDKGTADAPVAEHILSQPEWSNRPDLITKLLKRGKADVAIANLLIQPQWENHPELVERLFESNNINQYWFAQTLLQQPHWKKHPELVEKLIDKGTADDYVAQYILSQPEWSNRPDLVEKILNRGTADNFVVQYILSQPEWSKRPDVITKLLKRGKADVAIADLLIQPQWENHPELAEKLIESKNINPTWLAQTLLQQPHWKKHPELVEKLIDKGTADAPVAKYILSQPEWRNRPDLIEKLIDKGTADEYVVRYILSRPEWSNRPDLIKTLLKKGTADVAIADLLIQPQWENHPELAEKLIESKNINPDWLARTLLRQPHWKKHPHLVEKLIDQGTADAQVAEYILSQPEWSNRQDLIKKLIERGHGNYLKKALKPDAPATSLSSSTTATTDTTPDTFESDTKSAKKSGNCLVRFIKNFLR